MDTLLGGLDVRGLSMLAGWLMVDATLRVTVLLLAVALVAFGLRRASATARHLVWCLGVCGALVLPLLGVLLPTWELAVLPRAAPAPGEPRPVVHALDEGQVLHAPLPDEGRRPLRAGVVTVERAPAPGRARGERAVAVIVPAVHEELVPVAAHVNVDTLAEPAVLEARPSRPAGPWAWVLGVWLLGAVGVSLRLVLARVAVWHLGAKADPVDDGRLLSHLQGTLRTLRIERPVRLLESDAVSLPITWGVLHPTVLLPLDARLWTPGRLDQVLLHELAHIKRLDALTQLLAQLACAFYWFHPLVWLAERRMRTLREYACDDQVLAAGTRASDYARELLEMVRTMGRADLAHSATLAMARPSQLEERLRAILDPARRRAALGRARAAMLGLGAFAFVLPLAALQPAQAQETPRPEQGQEQPRVEQQRPRTLPRLSSEESKRRRTDYRPEALAETAPAGQAPEEGEGEERRTWMADPVEEARRKAREQEREEARGEEREDTRREAVAAPAPAPAPAPVVNPALPAPPEPRRDRWEQLERSGSASGMEQAIAAAARDARSEEELVRSLQGMLRHSDLPQEGERQAFLRAVERVRDSGRRAGLLVQVLRECAITENTGRTLLDVARGISDDGHLLKVLGWVHRINEKEVMHGPLMVEVLRTVETLRGPDARAKALRQLLDEAPITVDTGRSVLGLAAGLRNDRLAGKVLARMHEIKEHELVRGPLANDYLEVTRRMGSGEEQARALVRLLHNQPLTRDVTVRALEVARSIGSAEARGTVLRATDAVLVHDEDVRSAVEALARSVPGMSSAAFARGEDPGEGTWVDGKEPKDKEKEKAKHEHRHVWGTARSWSDLSPEERERVREEVRRAREEVRRAREEAKEASRQARERAREEAQRAREEAQRAREEARAEAQRAREEAQREAERAREEAHAEAQREREEAQREAERERAIAQRNEGRDGRARERIEVEVRRFEEAKQALRAQAEQLRAEADKLAAQMRERVEEIRSRVKSELERAGIQDFDLDDTFEYEFDVDIDVD